MTDLDALIAKVEGLTGGDEEMDCILHSVVALGRRVTEDGNDIWEHDDRLGKRLLGRLDPGKVQRNFNIHVHPGPRYTSDLNAAVSLVEAKLPGWFWKLDSDNNALVMPGDEIEQPVIQVFGKQSPALALIAALLRALKAQEHGKG